MADSASGSGPASHRGQPAGREVVLVGLMFLAGVVGILTWLALTPARTREAERPSRVANTRAEASSYVGDWACRECHPGEFEAHRNSGHSRTLRRAATRGLARRLDGRTLNDPEQPEATWRFQLQDGRFTTERVEKESTERFLIDYAFGSGHHATTFVSLIDRDPNPPRILEHRLTYYGHSGALDVTPGQSRWGHAEGNTLHGRVHTPENTLACFACHTTVTSDRGSTILDESTMIPNVSCERCHGPARSHVEAARRGADVDALAMPFGLNGWTTEEQMRLCGRCHRLPEMMRPGTIRVENPALVRHQTVGLSRSTCYTKSQGALHCLTCHDPHETTSHDRVAYESACLDCHQGPNRPHCSVSPRSDCLDCHMPRRLVTRGMIMTDHWIRILPQSRGKGTHPAAPTATAPSAASTLTAHGR